VRFSQSDLDALRRSDREPIENVEAVTRERCRAAVLLAVGTACEKKRLRTGQRQSSPGSPSGVRSRRFFGHSPQQSLRNWHCLQHAGNVSGFA
jgi:hypothetical protein